jgi:uncharacterized protein with HEPN domain
VTGKSRRATDYAADILQAIGRIRAFSAGATFQDFDSNRMLQDAVLRNFEVIGEAAKCLMRDCAPLVAEHPEIPWKAMYEMRNLLAHRYFLVDLTIVWDAMQQNLPMLDQQIQSLQRKLAASPE